EVAAAAAVRRGPGGEFALPAGFRMLPAAGGRGQSVGREHTLTAETEFEVRDLVDVVRRVVLGLLEARLQVRVLVELGQGVPRSHVPGLETLLPGHPFGCDEGVGARQQSRLADRDLLRARGAGEHGHPAPAPVVRVVAHEEVGDQAGAFGHGAQMFTDEGAAGNLGDGAPGDVDRRSQLGVEDDLLRLGPAGARGLRRTCRARGPAVPAPDSATGSAVTAPEASAPTGAASASAGRASGAGASAATSACASGAGACASGAALCRAIQSLNSDDIRTPNRRRSPAAGWPPCSRASGPGSGRA